MFYKNLVKLRRLQRLRAASTDNSVWEIGDEFAREKSCLCGKSTHNQRIECFWGLFLKEMGQFFMDMFSDFGRDHNDLFCGDMLDKNLIHFCLLEVIQICNEKDNTNYM